MNSGIKFSIITPCFNSGRTIERTLKSLASQSYKNFEYIIIDGMSSDNTMQIIEGYRGIFERDRAQQGDYWGLHLFSSCEIYLQLSFDEPASGAHASVHKQTGGHTSRWRI